MRYIILGGSVAFDRYDLLETTLDSYIKETGDKPTIIIADQKSGTPVGSGIGFLGAKYCREKHIPVLTFTTPTAATPMVIMRNGQIAKFIAEECEKEKLPIAVFIFLHENHELDFDGRTLASAMSMRKLGDSVHYISMKVVAKDAYTGPRHIETSREEATQDGGQKD